MWNRIKQKSAPKTIGSQISRLLLTMSVAAVVIILALIIMLFDTNLRYTVILQNANTAADFNTGFKETIDSEMYNHVIRPRNEVSAEDLPTDELDRVIEVLERLEKTTTLPDNIWRIQSMKNMCENLRGYMEEIAETTSYDLRMELLDRNVRGETGLTRLIETYMHAYLDAEVREMSRMQQSLRRRISMFVGGSVLALAALCVYIFVLSEHVSKEIAEPLEQLSVKAASFGNGDFAALPVKTEIAELQELDRGFDEMAAHIQALMGRQIEAQKSLHKAELDLLQSQINPHFLYNTLDSIAILAENGGEEQAVQMVNSLSSFFRISLSKGRDIISLADEKNHVTSYLEIQHIRYSDILEYEISIDDSILGVMVPKLILQPLVENALYHGIKSRRGMGRIVITGCRKDGDILLTVTDNGVGMDEQQLQALRDSLYGNTHNGLGIINVHKRVRLYCGEPYGLLFESEKGRGTSVSVLLPSNMNADGSFSETEAKA